MNCPICSGETVERLAQEDFELALPNGKSQTLSVTVPTFTCNPCFMEFTDDKAEKIRDEAARIASERSVS